MFVFFFVCVVVVVLLHLMPWPFDKQTEEAVHQGHTGRQEGQPKPEESLHRIVVIAKPKRHPPGHEEQNQYGDDLDLRALYKGGENKLRE